MTDDPRSRILVVDDNPATLYATTRIVRAAGFEVLQAESGNEALSLAPRVDLVVLDVNLPDIDGFQVCRQLRARPETARTPVLHLSATFVKDVDKVTGLEAGADGYLTHPVEPPVLIATINAFLRARQAEDAMRQSEAKFRAIFEQTPNGIALVSQDLIFLEVNPALARMFGRPREEVVGKHVSAFMPQRSEDTAVGIAGELEARRGWRGTFRVIRSDGARVELEWDISTHSVPGVRLAIVTDVTERRAIEAERERLLGSERAARTEAERANRIKDDFLATLSHELRTPLNAIVGWSQVLKGGQVSHPDMLEGLDAIDRNARAQAQLIADLLDVSRITSGKLRLDVRPVDLAATVAEALEAVMPAALAKQITVERALDPAAGQVVGDPARLQQVIWNLVTNAVKFTPRGGLVRVTLDRLESAAQISVIDNGQGISPAFLPHLFERFRQEDATTTRNHGGLGLGLAIVKHLVEMHGGTVTAESPGDGLGATFKVRVPLAALRPESPQPGAQAPSPHPQPPSPNSNPCSMPGVRVLVVDDDPDSRAIVTRVLRACDLEVEGAPDVPAARDALRTFKPHVLSSDIGMPGQDGYDLIRQVRAGCCGPSDLPSIALTAFARAEDQQQALAAGFQSHLAKPVDRNELIATIAALVDRNNSKPATGTPPASHPR
jgi:PAS domain S-box-containing protein